ncbi:MAG TPA: 2,3,4,5-tetrahydropyridine-2,6-dicarboxylate N-succinyltransferase [Candidatus Dormibacteraeota bacterium]|nr:2,3,4,5-tetrahydropyridine-2,6-dicarboxylate N-succinyltransferase [Candidatus Dormibacteraeota bacterium]
MQPSEIEGLFDEPPAHYTEQHRATFRSFINRLNQGEIRAAEPDASSKTGWRVNSWVKKGILLGFRIGEVVDMSVDRVKQPFLDKNTYPVKSMSVASQVRIVPGGSSIRDGSYIGRGVVCMPPMFINVGAYVGDGTMVDSHALVGSCAQVGRNCHISAGAQIGGVLEPIGAVPVIIEDDVMIGGNSGLYEGVIVKRRAVLGSGTIINRSTPVYDLVRDEIYTAKDSEPLIIPEEAIVVPGARALSHPAGQKWGLSLYVPVIVKYRDKKTDARVQLEEFLR